MTLLRLLPFVSGHTENGIKLVLALLGPVLATLLGHWRISTLRSKTLRIRALWRAAPPKPSSR